MSGKRGAIQRPLAERFWEKVEITETCWLWTSCLNGAGYGFVYRNDTGKPDRAHRVTYEWFKGPIPSDLVVDHLCRVRHCVNPDHMELVTRGENVRRGTQARTHCRRGHSYDDAYVSPAGARQCRTCNTLRSKGLLRP